MVRNIIIWSILIMPSEAYGYIDPGTGSVALQAIFAAVAAGWLFFGRIKRAVYRLFTR